MKLENIFYINLEHRNDRKQHVEHQLKSVGLKGERFNAIKMKDGRVGCTLSHIKCLETAMKNNLDHIFICEDDITFTNPNVFKKSLDKFLNDETINWDVCIVGGNNAPPFQRVTSYCVKISRCQTTTGYIVKKHYYKTLLDNYKEGLLNLMKNPAHHYNFAIDKYWLHLQEKDNWYLIIPLTVIQLEGFSDIENKSINYYGELMLDLDKKVYFEKREKARQDFIRRIIEQQMSNLMKGKMNNLLNQK